jgi:hypothetical protein
MRDLQSLKAVIRRALGNGGFTSCNARATKLTSGEQEYLSGWTAGAALVAGSSGPSLVDFWLRNRRHMNACDGSFMQGYRAALLTALDRRA